MRIAIDWNKRWRELAILLAIGTFLTIVGPFGSIEDVPFWKGWLFWTGLIIIGAFLGEFITGIILRHTERLPILVSLGIVSVVITFIMTPIVITFAIAIRGAWAYFGILDYWVDMVGLVWVISAFMTGIGYLLNRTFGLPVIVAPQTTESSDPTAAFLERLPVKYRTATLYAVSSEDHYLRVHTSFGEELILMRLADAIRELGGAKGRQTHRSWWVAEEAIEDVERENGRVVLVLKSGSRAPVSRTFQADLKAAGWLNGSRAG